MIIETMAVGSRVTCSPPPSDTDEDYLVLISEDTLEQEIERLQNNGFEYDSKSKYPGDTFTSLRKDTLNYIITTSRDFYDKFATATKIAKKLNLMKKEDRVNLFQAVLYGKYD